MPEPAGLDDERKLREAVADVIKRQRDIGLDVVNEGELTKRGDWLSYLENRFDVAFSFPKNARPILTQL